MISDNSIIQKSEELLMSTIDNEAVILGIEIRKYIGLNEMGTYIWNQIEKPVRVSTLIHSLTEQFDETGSVIHDQVIEFLGLLYQKSLIQVLDET
jgi:hypothetical protein